MHNPNDPDDTDALDRRIGCFFVGLMILVALLIAPADRNAALAIIRWTAIVIGVLAVLKFIAHLV